MLVDSGIQVSFIIPACNAVGTLLRAIKSILNITEFGYEILIICNNCSDNTAELVENFKTENRLSHLKIHNRLEIKGASAARNLGIENALGKWICFVDADDYIEPSNLELLIGTCHDPDASELAVAAHWLYKDGQISVKTHALDRSQLIENEQINKYLLDYCYVPYRFTLFVHCWGKLYSRNKILTNRIFFEDKLTQLEDVNFNLKYLKNVNRVYYSNVPFYIYDTGSNDKSLSVRSGYEPNAYKNIYTALKPVKDFIMKIVSREDGKRAISQLLTSIGRIWIIRISKNSSLSISQSITAIDRILGRRPYKVFQIRYACRYQDSKLLDFFCRYTNAGFVVFLLFLKSRWRY